MACVLTVHREADTLALPLTASGRLAAHLAAGGALTIENSPAQAADSGGRLPIYRNGALAYTVPFTCAGIVTRSSGASGGSSSAGSLDGGAAVAGSRAGRLF